MGCGRDESRTPGFEPSVRRIDHYCRKERAITSIDVSSRAPAPGRAVTNYGGRNQRESFAEAFAVFVLDKQRACCSTSEGRGSLRDALRAVLRFQLGETPACVVKSRSSASV